MDSELRISFGSVVFGLPLGGTMAIALAALAAAVLAQHLGRGRGGGAGLLLAGWALGGAALMAVVLLFSGEPYEQTCSGSEGQWSCSRIEVGRGQPLLALGLALPVLAVWSVLYAVALAGCRLVYDLVVPRQRVGR